jgi:hypothetical protein
MIPMQRVRITITMEEQTHWLLRMIAAMTKTNQGEVVDRLVATEADRLRIRLTQPDPEAAEVLIS